MSNPKLVSCPYPVPGNEESDAVVRTYLDHVETCRYHQTLERAEWRKVVRLVADRISADTRLSPETRKRVVGLLYRGDC